MVMNVGMYDIPVCMYVCMCVIFQTPLMQHGSNSAGPIYAMSSINCGLTLVIH